MATYTPPSAADRLARLKQMQEGLSKLKLGFETGVLSLKPGVTVVRILPPVGNMDQRFYHQQVGYHMIGNTVVRCSEFTTSYDLKCPVCEVDEVLRRGGPKDKARHDLIRLQKRYWMNVIVRAERDSFDTAEGPLVLKAGVTIFERTRSLVADPDYGLIDDVEKGQDLKIEKTGEKINTKYEVNPRKGDYQPLIVGSDGKIDWDAVTKIMEAAKDLSAVRMPDNPDDDAAFLEELGADPIVKVYGYDRTVNQYGVCLDTIHALDEIIEANKGQGEGEEADGSHAKPVRGSNGNDSGTGKGANVDIKARIAQLRQGKN